MQLNMPLQHQDDPGRPDFYKVLLYIDEFIIKIQRPDGTGDAYFCGRNGKSCDSINVQFLNDKTSRVRHVITGLSGSTRDKTAAAWSATLRQFLDALPDACVDLGNPAYRGLHRKCITTITSAGFTQEQQSFNQACTRLCRIVERTIGASQSK